VCKGQLINSTLYALEYVYIMNNKREYAHMRSNVEIIKLCEKVGNCISSWPPDHF